MHVFTKRLISAIVILFAIAVFNVCASTIEVDPDNAYLPKQITLGVGTDKVPLLAEKNALNFTFTDFRNRNKFYREENKEAWPGQTDPRFTVEPRDVEPVNEARAAVMVESKAAYSTSYAQVLREFRLPDSNTIIFTYRITPTEDLLVYEPGMFGFSLRLAEHFDTQLRLDARPGKQGQLIKQKTERPTIAVTTHHGGPLLFHSETHGVSLLATYSVPKEAPTNLWTLAKGESFEFELTLQVFKEEKATAVEALKALSISPTRRPFALYENGRALFANGKLKEAEDALLLAAQLNVEFASPYSFLAQMRRDSKDASELRDMTQAQAWTEAAYRMPYNYGYILSGSGFYADKHLTEEQKRLAIFNTLIAVENTQFYADYYAWAARPFEQMNMPVQACAIIRQALWALDYLPRSEKHKDKVRKQLEAKLAALEKQILEEEAELPPLIPIRPNE